LQNVSDWLLETNPHLLQASNGYISVRTREKIRIKVRYTSVYPRLPAVGRFQSSISSSFIIAHYIFSATYFALDEKNIVSDCFYCILVCFYRFSDAWNIVSDCFFCVLVCFYRFSDA
jgi:hypothetical protein